jgi:hypothetical protein
MDTTMHTATTKIPTGPMIRERMLGLLVVVDLPPLFVVEPPPLFVFVFPVVVDVPGMVGCDDGREDGYGVAGGEYIGACVDDALGGMDADGGGVGGKDAD